MKAFILLILVFSLKISHTADINTNAFAQTPIIYNGRVVPFDTYARSLTKDIANNIGEAGKEPVKFCLQLLDTSIALKDHKVFAVSSKTLQKLLNVDNPKRLYSQSELISKDQFQQLLKFYNKNNSGTDNTDPDMVEFASLINKFDLFNKFVNGESLFIFPSKDPKAKWLNLPMLRDLDTEESEKPVDLLISLLVSIKGNSQEAFDKACVDLHQYIYMKDPNIDQSRIQVETIYNMVRPFAWSYILYFIAILIGVLLKHTKFWYLSILTGLLGFVISTLGISARIYILNRPPAGNTYESIIFASWFCILISMIFFHKKNQQNYFQLSILTALFILSSKFILPVTEDMLNLNAVLSSNAWLSFHVLTTVASYGVLAFCSMLAHYYLFLSTKQQNPSDMTITYIHNSMKLGVFLLGLGTVLGGIWAHNSWGRFWAWNPKETWVMITLISYLLILHAKRIGWINQYIVALSSILAFIFLLVTWYGVNIFLDTGEHSFSIGVANSKIAILFVLFELLYITTIQRKRLATHV